MGGIKSHVDSLTCIRVKGGMSERLRIDSGEVDEKIDEGVLRWFSHVERMEKDRLLRGSM